MKARRYVLPLTCGDCGGELEHVTAQAAPSGATSAAAADCPDCGSEWVVRAELVRRTARRSPAVA